jgi:serine/threonine protein kinase
MGETFSPEAVVLSDFGFCRRFDAGVSQEDYCGSPHYSAPELYRQQPYTEKVDIWALGITMYALLTGRMPFDANDYDAMVREILRGMPNLLETGELLFVSEPCRELLDWMLSPEAGNRPSADQAMAHPWFEELCEAKPTDATVGVKVGLFEELVSA